MRKIFYLLTAVISMLVIDYAIPAIFPLVSKNNYLLGFEKFYNIAEKTKGQDRIILVGGSSLGWGVSAETLSENLEVLTLNSGIHAGVGYRNFVRNVSEVTNINRDLFVISPEYSVVKGGGVLNRSDEFCIIALYVRRVYPMDCVGYSVSSFFQILPVLNKLNLRSQNDEYFKDGFNKFGDYTHRNSGLNMTGKMMNQDTCSSWSIQDLTKEYIPFIDGLIDAGYEIVYVPNFTSSMACQNVDKITKFHELMFERYGIEPFLNTQLFFAEQYFYNTAYHLTRNGVSLKTKIFENQLRHYLTTREPKNPLSVSN